MGDVRTILNLTRGNVLCEHVEVADRFLPRMRGVLGRPSLPRGQGILLQPAPSIHTAFVRFRFDAVFLDGGLRVIRIVANLKPWRVVMARHGVSVLELSAGEAARRKVAVGDQVMLIDGDLGFGPAESPGAQQDSGTADRQIPPVEVALSGATPSAAVDTGSLPAAGLEGEQAPHVLLVGSDRRFRAVAATLLQRRGYLVTTGDHVASTADLALREGVDVVVLDAGATPAVAALEAARLETLSPPVGMVLVSDDPVRELPATQVVPKWGSFDGLYDAIELVRSARGPS
jgi:uncharacterized membrane protein (UPF0127 family)